MTNRIQGFQTVTPRYEKQMQKSKNGKPILLLKVESLVHDQNYGCIINSLEFVDGDMKLDVIFGEEFLSGVHDTNEIYYEISLCVKDIIERPI